MKYFKLIKSYRPSGYLCFGGALRCHWGRSPAAWIRIRRCPCRSRLQGRIEPVELLCPVLRFGLMGCAGHTRGWHRNAAEVNSRQDLVPDGAARPARHSLVAHARRRPAAPAEHDCRHRAYLPRTSPEHPRILEPWPCRCSALALHRHGARCKPGAANTTVASANAAEI